MLFRNLTNHQRWLAISSCFTNSKRSNLGLYLGGCLNQENLRSSCSAFGGVAGSIQYSRVLFISDVAALRCERHTSGDLVTSRQFYNSSLQK